MIFFPFLLDTLICTWLQLKVFPRKNLLVRGRQFATKAHLEQNLGPLCDGRYNIKWNSLFTHLIYWIGEGSRTHRRADCLWETLFGGLSLSLPPELHTQFVPNPGDMIGRVLQVCGFRLAETSDYFFHVVDLCGGDEETLKPPRHEEESSLPHLGNLEWAWSLSTIWCTSVTRRTGHLVFVLFLTLVSVMKHSWPIQTLRWAKRVSWVGQSTRVT